MYNLLVVESAALRQRILSDVLSSRYPEAKLTIVEDAFSARVAIARRLPDAILVDLEFPKLRAEDVLPRLASASPSPVLVIARRCETQHRQRFIELGATSVIIKAESISGRSEFATTLCATLGKDIGIRPVSAPGIQPAGARLKLMRPSLIAIGSSTGGPRALEMVLSNLQADCPPVIVAQHLSDRFVDSLANRLDQVSRPNTVIAEDGMEVRPGTIHIIPPTGHMRLAANMRLKQTPLEEANCISPSVNELFDSLASVCPHSTIAVLLTGMGNDGARGMLALHRAGGTTVAQDESSCVVFGMPRKAIELNAVSHVMPLQDIGPTLASANTRYEIRKCNN